MAHTLKQLSLAVAYIAVGGIAGVFGYSQLMQSDLADSMGLKTSTANIVSTESVDEPLYWVAPMDPNYRRDKAGKSPMGMDLIPVFAEGASSGPDAGPGTIRIAPDVVNNLGVRSAQVKWDFLDLNVRTVGYVQYNQDNMLHIHPRVEGWIETSFVKASGESVKKGQPLYSLYSPALVNAQEEYLFALNRKDERLLSAAKARLAALNVSAASINALKKSRKVSQAVTFFASQDGVVDQFNLVEGMYVKPGMELLSIADLNEVWVEAEVFERQAASVREGLEVSIALDYLPGKRWDGVVDYVYPALNQRSRTLSVRLRFSNEDRLLKPNMFAKVNIKNETSFASLTVPKEAVIRVGDSSRVVLALGEGRFKSIKVDTGRSDQTNTEILFGLEEGDKVVTSALFLLDSESSKTSDFKRLSYSDMKSSDMDEVNDMSQMDHSQMDHSQMDMGEMDMSQMDHSQMDMGEMDHSQMDMSQMDHSQMDMSQMDHSQMDMSQMNHADMAK